jgi:O-antigen ligase
MLKAAVNKPSLFLMLFLLSTAAAILTGKLLILFLPFILLIVISGLSNPRFFYFLLLFTIPLSTEFKITPALGTDLPDETLMWLLTPLIIFIIVRNRDVLSGIFSQPIMKILVLSLCWTLVTVACSELPVVSIKYFVAKIWYIIPFVIGTVLFLKTRADLAKAAFFMLVPMAFTVLVILIRHGLDGFRFDSANEVTKPFFRNHVNYGALLVCMIPVCFAMFRSVSKRWLPVLLVLAGALAFSYSRGAWLAMGAAVVVVYFIRKGRLSWLIVAASAVIIGISAWLLDNNRYLNFRPVYERTIYHESFDEHMEATYNMQDLSTMERFYRWIAAVNMVKENWVTGSGPNSFYPLYKSYTVNEFTTYVSNNPEKSTVHNYFLLLLTEQGVPGMLLFAALYITMLLTAQGLYLRSRDVFVKGLMLLVGALLAMIGVLIFLSDLIETDKIGSVFYICAGLLVAAGSGSYVERIAQPIAKEVEGKNQDHDR